MAAEKHGMLYEQGRAYLEMEEIFVPLGLPSDQARVRAERDQA